MEKELKEKLSEFAEICCRSQAGVIYLAHPVKYSGWVDYEYFEDLEVGPDEKHEEIGFVFDPTSKSLRDRHSDTHPYVVVTKDGLVYSIARVSSHIPSAFTKRTTLIHEMPATCGRITGNIRVTIDPFPTNTLADPLATICAIRDLPGAHFVNWVRGRNDGARRWELSHMGKIQLFEPTGKVGLSPAKGHGIHQLDPRDPSSRDVMDYAFETHAENENVPLARIPLPLQDEVTPRRQSEPQQPKNQGFSGRFRAACQAWVESGSSAHNTR